MANSLTIFKNPSANHGGIFYLRSLLLLCFLFLVATSYSQAKLSIGETKKNFGFVQRGTQVKNLYEIKNAGNAPLLITEAEVACSCTSVDFPKQPLLPGQSATITVNFNTTTVYGRQDRVVLLKSNDPQGPHKLRFKGTVSRQ